MSSQKAIYTAKHAFNGQRAQNQLSFPIGARIVAAPNQLGAWWWGNCNGVVSSEWAVGCVHAGLGGGAYTVPRNPCSAQLQLDPRC